MRETTLRATVCAMLRSIHQDPDACENGASPGCPDVNYLHGWIELKVLPGWPMRDATPVRVSTFTPQQRLWLRRRRAVGGRAHLLLVVGSEWLLFDGAVAARELGQATKAELLRLAQYHWLRKPTPGDLLLGLLEGR